MCDKRAPVLNSGGFQVALTVKNLPANAGDARYAGSILESGNGNLLQYSCLENPMHRGAQRVAVHGVVKESDMT